MFRLRCDLTAGHHRPPLRILLADHVGPPCRRHGRGHAHAQRLVARREGRWRQAAGVRVVPWRRLHDRLGQRAGLRRRSAGAFRRRRRRHGQSSARRARLPGSRRCRRFRRIRRRGLRRAARSRRLAEMGAREHREFRRRSDARLHLRPVGRRCEDIRDLLDAGGERPVQSRGRAIGLCAARSDARDGREGSAGVDEGARRHEGRAARRRAVDEAARCTTDRAGARIGVLARGRRGHGVRPPSVRPGCAAELEGRAADRFVHCRRRSAAPDELQDRRCGRKGRAGEAVRARRKRSASSTLTAPSIRTSRTI